MSTADEPDRSRSSTSIHCDHACVYPNTVQQQQSAPAATATISTKHSSNNQHQPQWNRFTFSCVSPRRQRRTTLLRSAIWAMANNQTALVYCAPYRVDNRIKPKRRALLPKALSSLAGQSGSKDQICGNSRFALQRKHPRKIEFRIAHATNTGDTVTM